jgi:hypothetical protein
MRRSLIAALPLLLTACTTADVAPIDAPGKDGSADDADDDEDDQEAVPLDVTDAARWRCIGAPSDDLERTVLRLELQFGATIDDDVVAMVTSAPWFLRRGLTEVVTTTPPAPSRWTFSLQADATTAVLQGENRVLTLTATTQPALATAVLNDAGSTVALTCWDEAALRSSMPAAYNAELGRCVDDNGQPARNAVPLAVVHETGFGECVDFGSVQLNDEDYGYPVFLGWNLRGANLDTASISFASLIDADLRGAQLAQFSFGYAEITGTIDDATAPPTPCTVDGDQLSCLQ